MKNRFVFKDLFTLPNIASWIRIPLAAVLLCFYDDKAVFFGILLFAIFTDWLDGYLARKMGSTWLGGILDPLCDKIFVLVLVVFLLRTCRLEVWQLALVILRDIFVVLSASFVYFHPRKQLLHQHIRARWPGKTVTAMQFVIIVWAFLEIGYLNILMVVLSVASLAAIIDYSLWIGRVVSNRK